MNTCVVRVPGPDVANVTRPRVFSCRTGSSVIVAFLQSIDETTTAPADPVLPYDPQLCPDSL